MTHSIGRFFADMPDPRRDQGKRHQLSDMIVIAVCAVICAADSWADVADFGQAKLPWFETFLDLPHGIASQDTFERVFGDTSKKRGLKGKRLNAAWDHNYLLHLLTG